MVSIMRLERVPEPPGFTCVCLTCKQVIPGGTTKIADLNGPPFAAFFHTTCTPHNARAARDLYIRLGWREVQTSDGYQWRTR
jgi:hypothetical protein